MLVVILPLALLVYWYSAMQVDFESFSLKGSGCHFQMHVNHGWFKVFNIYTLMFIGGFFACFFFSSSSSSSSIFDEVEM